MRARLLAPALAATFLLLVIVGLVGLFVMAPPRQMVGTADTSRTVDPKPTTPTASEAVATLEPVQVAETDPEAVGSAPTKRVVSVIPINGATGMPEAETTSAETVTAEAIVPEIGAEVASDAAPLPVAPLERATAELSAPLPIDEGTYIPTPRPIEERPGRIAQAEAAPTITDESQAQPGNCAALDSLTDRDGDFQRNRKAVVDGKVCVTEERFADAGAEWVVHVTRPTDGRAGPLWVVPHDDEDVAFDNGIDAVAQYGGVLVSVETGGRRNNGSIDPNRIFADEAQACGGAAPQYTRLVLANRSNGYPVVGLHSNDRGSSSTGGAGTISIDAPLKSATPYKASPFIPSESNEDTLVFVASTQPKGSDPKVDGMVETLLKNGMNVIRELVTPKTNDCSLSNYLALRELQPYYNLEVVHGDRRHAMEHGQPDHGDELMPKVGCATHVIRRNRAESAAREPSFPRGPAHEFGTTGSPSVFASQTQRRVLPCSRGRE